MYTQQLDEVEASIHEVINRMDSVIKTVPGVGDLNGTMIIREIKYISRFESPCQSLAYARLVPLVYQSANFHASKKRMFKQGSKLRRYPLINTAWQIALGHIAHKLVRILHKMMTENAEFNLA